MIADGSPFDVELETQDRPDPWKLSSDMRKISGKVISVEDDAPLPGASIIVKGTTLGTVSNLDGSFELAIPISTDELVVSYVGLKTMDIRLGGKNFVNIIMETDILGLDPVGVKYIKETGETIGITDVNELPRDKRQPPFFQMIRSWFRG